VSSQYSKFPLPFNGSADGRNERIHSHVFARHIPTKRGQKHSLSGTLASMANGNLRRLWQRYALTIEYDEVREVI
jgi:hypothetical protein